jgi:hypothetical protein
MVLNSGTTVKLFCPMERAGKYPYACERYMRSDGKPETLLAQGQFVGALKSDDVAGSDDVAVENLRFRIVLDRDDLF